MKFSNSISDFAVNIFFRFFLDSFKNIDFTNIIEAHIKLIHSQRILFCFGGNSFFSKFPTKGAKQF
jgi:hypothetical protein